MLPLVASMAQIHGFVKEKDSNTSLEYANIAFVAPDDSTIIAYAVADSTGYFKLNSSKTEVIDIRNKSESIQ